MRVFLATLTLALATAHVEGTKSPWWQTAVFYQIYPRSYMDSNGDGIGDLPGITKKLEHIKDAGATATWLSPIYKSPQVDMGYDISDYRDIHDEYGTMEDFEQLIDKAKELELKIIMDFVPNHSSNKHEWFALSENRTEGYEDYYVWRDGRNGDDKIPPNNWISVFKYSAWTYSPIRKQWYLHQFTPQQPDLNFENPKVLAEMIEVMSFWLEKGVYGFRIDAVPHIGESQSFEDEPLSGLPGVEDWEYDYLLHWYTKDMPRSYDVIYKIRAFLDRYNQDRPDEDDRIIMTEAYANISATMKWYGDGEKEGAQFTFNFLFVTINTSTSAGDVVGMVKEWMSNMPENKTANWVIGNHDRHRLGSRVHPLNIDGYNMLLHILPGVAVTYQGEEIGMPDGNVTWEEGKDPSACNGLPEQFDQISRDFERTPYHWDATKNAGFSIANQTWLPVSEKYLENNLAQQKTEENSHYKIYQSLTALRKESVAMKEGDLTILNHGNVIIVKRSVENESLIYLFNLGEDNQSIDLTKHFPSIKTLDVVISANCQQQLWDLTLQCRKIKSVKNINLHGHVALIAKAY